MSKLVLTLLFICIFNFAFAAFSNMNDQLDEWSWENCQGQYKAYSVYKNSQSKDQIADDEKVFDCAHKFYTLEFRLKCEETEKMVNLKTEAKSFYEKCVIPFFDEFYSRQDAQNICSEEKDKCRQCNNDSKCKTINKCQTSPKYDEYKAFKDQLDDNCKISTLCPSTLHSVGQKTCKKIERQNCEIIWKLNNLTQDVCYDAEKCVKNIKFNFGIITKFSVFILLTFLVL